MACGYLFSALDQRLAAGTTSTGFRTGTTSTGLETGTTSTGFGTGTTSTGVSQYHDWIRMDWGVGAVFLGGNIRGFMKTVLL